jgi:hypothetical protein
LKKFINLLAKEISLTIILVIFFIFAALITGISEPSVESEAAQASNDSTLTVLLFSSLMQVMILSYIILRSQLWGWKLSLFLFMAFYGSMTFIPQIESLVYLPDKLPHDLIPKLFFMGLITTVLFSPLAVLILGKMRKSSEAEDLDSKMIVSKNEWIAKLGALTLIYLFLYYAFGYYVAWKNPVVREYYGGSDPGNFLAQLVQIGKTTPWMYPLQALRALLWILLVLPLTRSLKGSSWEIAFVMAAFFSVWSLQLLAPNPYMPSEVAFTHMIETISSNFVFGFILGWLLSKRHVSVRDVFRTA